MPFISGAIAVIGAIGSFIGTLGAVGTFVLQTAVGIGLSLAAKALAGTPEEQAAEQGVAGVQGELRAGGDLPRSFPLGYCGTAGSLVYANYWGMDGDTPNAFLTQVISLADLPGQGPPRVFVNGEVVTLDTSEQGMTAGAGGQALVEQAWQAAIASGISPLGFPAFIANYINTHGGTAGGPTLEYGWPVVEYRKDGKDHLWIKYYDGTQTTADTFLSNRVASSDRPWGPDRIGKGICYVIATALVNDELFTGFPEFRFEMTGIRLYDPSRDDTAGGSGPQRWSDPSTWGGDGDQLPAVQIYSILRGITYEGEWLYGLQGMSAARLPNASWINAINACRSQVQGETGNEPAYRAGHELRVSTTIADTLEVLLTACQGRLSEIGGVYKLHVGPPGAPVASFTDADILSTEEQSFTPFFGLSDTVTGIAATYPEPTEAWVTKTAPPLYRTDLEAQASGRRLLSDVKFNAVPYAAQVQRLMKSALAEAQRARRHTFVLPPAFWVLEPGDVVEWTSERNGYVQKLFRVDGIVDKANLDVLVDLTEVDPSDYDWNFDTDFTPVDRFPPIFQRPAPQSILDWFAAPDIVYDANGLARRPAIRLEWDNTVVDGIAAVQFEVRNDFGDKEVVHRGRTENVAAGSILISQNLLPNTAYEVRGRYMPSSPRETLWSDWYDVTTPNVLISEQDIIQSLLYQITELENQFDDRLNAVEAAFTRVINQHAGNWSDKQVIKREFSSRTATALAVATEAFTVATSTEEAFAAYQVTVSAQFDDVIASVDINADAIATLDGYAASRYGVTLDVNGYASGFQLVNGGSGFSTFTVIAEQFQIAQPGQSGGSPVTVFTVGTVNGSTKLALRGDMLIDGLILARMIGAGQVTADKIQAQSIGTNQLAIGGVDIHNLIANAATKTDFYPAGAIALPGPGVETVVANSGFVNYPVACPLLIDFDLDYSTGVANFSGIAISRFPRLIVHLKVNGSTIRTAIWETVKVAAGSAGYVQGANEGATGSFKHKFDMPAGSHQIYVTAQWENPSFAVGIIANPQTNFSSMVVTQLRR